MNLYYVCFCLSLLVFLLSILISYINKDKKSKSLTILLVGILIASGFLVFATYSKLDIATNLIHTVFYVFDVPTMKGDFDILNNVPKELLSQYKYLLYIYCILAPILTVGVVITFLENKIYELKSKIKTNKTVHIFSEINEKSVTLAETIKNKNNVVIMCDNSNKQEFHDRLTKIKCILLKKQINDIDFTRYLGKILVYEISEDQDQNLNKTLDLIKINKSSTKDITIYIFSNKSESQIILDSVDKGNLKTIIINEIQQMVYRVLDEVPLYKNSEDIISVLIIGAGKIGTEFIKTILWCGQIINYKLEINIIDKNAKKQEKEFLCKYPELKSENYNIHFYESDINSIEAYNIIDKNCQNINYIIVALGNDSDNLNCAIEMRKFFLRKNQLPIINLNIENSEKKKQVQLLKNEKGLEYNLNAFGGIKELYGQKNILNDKIETLAQKVHLNYNPDDINLSKYYKMEYYKNSSRATALHLKYKIYSILKDEHEDNKKLNQLLKDEKIKNLLAENEHNRWCAYIRSMGYSCATMEQVKKSKELNDNYINHLAKLHPALVPYKELDNVSKEISKIMNDKIDLKKKDFDIINTLLKMNEEDKNV